MWKEFVMNNNLLNVQFLRHGHFTLVYFYHLLFHVQLPPKKFTYCIAGPIEVLFKRIVSTKIENYMCNEDVQILSISTINKPPPVTNLLQQLQCKRQKIDGDGNCLYYAVTHQAGYIACT